MEVVDLHLIIEKIHVVYFSKNIFQPDGEAVSPPVEPALATIFPFHKRVWRHIGLLNLIPLHIADVLMMYFHFLS